MNTQKFKTHHHAHHPYNPRHYVVFVRRVVFGSARVGDHTTTPRVGDHTTTPTQDNTYSRLSADLSHSKALLVTGMTRIVIVQSVPEKIKLETVIKMKNGIPSV